jgi:hypothetical protein
MGRVDACPRGGTAFHQLKVAALLSQDLSPHPTAVDTEVLKINYLLRKTFLVGRAQVKRVFVVLFL